jgi:hypothetical protein
MMYYASIITDKPVQRVFHVGSHGVSCRLSWGFMSALMGFHVGSHGGI